ncbi:MAG: cyclic peptide export ABC transporter [Chitinophagaceae bacterium]
MKQFIKIVLPLIGKKELLNYFCLGVLSGLCNFLFINAVTRIVGAIAAGYYGSVSKEYIIIFFSIILVFIWVKRTLSLLMMKVSQRISWSLRKQILSLVLNSGYMQFSSRKHRIDSAIVNDVNTLTGASMGVIDFCISVIIVLSCFIYLATVSFLLFLITLGVAIIGAGIYSINARKNMLSFEKIRNLENRFQENFNSILNGYKEIYMEPGKGQHIFSNKIGDIANESYRTNLITMTRILNNSMTGQVLFYLLISSVLLVFSVVLSVKPVDVVSFVFTLTYLLGSIEAVMLMLPMLMRAGVAAGNLAQLRQELEDNVLPPSAARIVGFRESFETIQACELEFYYGDRQRSFGIGPINFEVNKGEAIFIYGGNGSGKTTFIYSLLGLYQPTAGMLRLNGMAINEATYAEYRSLFSVVFSDYYLFDEIITPQPVNLKNAAQYLKIFELEDKVTIEGNRFSTIDLSAGQKKRLALIAALLEDKPILVLDEWAADQDPHFRNKFYTEIVPLLKSSGITVVAITHDDKYYYCADKLFKMDEGKLIQRNLAIGQAGHIAMHQNISQY